MFVIFFVSSLAETNRAPFDLPEGESEIVAGFFVEYGAMAFALFFLGEYMNMILMSAMTTILFMGGWLGPFGLWPALGPLWFVLKVCFFLFVFIWVRGTFPRLPVATSSCGSAGRCSCPASLAYLVIVAGVLLAMGWLPRVA